MYVRGEGRFPNLEAWFEAMEQRPAYLGSRSDFYTHCHDLPPQLGGQLAGSLKRALPVCHSLSSTRHEKISAQCLCLMAREFGCSLMV